MQIKIAFLCTIYYSFGAYKFIKGCFNKGRRNFDDVNKIGYSRPP